MGTMENRTLYFSNVAHFCIVINLPHVALQITLCVNIYVYKRLVHFITLS